MESFLNEKNSKIENMKAKHEEEQEAKNRKIESEVLSAKPHFSVETLNLKRMEEQLAKQGL